MAQDLAKKPRVPLEKTIGESPRRSGAIAGRRQLGRRQLEGDKLIPTGVSNKNSIVSPTGRSRPRATSPPSNSSCRLGRDYRDVSDSIRHFMRDGAKTLINCMVFDGATKDPIQQAVRDALIAFMAATAGRHGRSRLERPRRPALLRPGSKDLSGSETEL